MSPRIPLLLGLVGAFWLRVRPLYDLDIGWHLSGARAVLQGGARSVPDPVSFAGPDLFVDGEWGFGVAMLAVHDLTGMDGVILVTAALAVLSFAAVVWCVRQAGAALAGAVAVGGVVATATSYHFLPRPQAAFLVLLPLAMGLALRARLPERREQALLMLHPLLAVWAQVHGSVTIAPFVVWSVLVGTRLRPRDLALAAALAVWPLTGAHGLDVVWDVLRHTDGDAIRYITDMRPPTLREAFPPSSSSWLLTEVLVVAAVALGVRRPGSIGGVLLVVLGAAMTATANRFRAAWAVLAAPLLGVGLAGRTVPPAVAWLGALPLLVAVVEAPRTGLGLDPTMVAEDLVQALEDRDVRGRLFNEYDHGGWLGWRAKDRVRLLIDGRTPTHFDADDLFAWRRAVREGPVFHRLHRTWSFDAVAILRDRPLCAWLAKSPAWTATWVGEGRVLFQPSEEEGVEHPDPCLPPVDPTPRKEDGGAGFADAWAQALERGEAREVADAAAGVLATHGHEAAPVVRLRRAQACLALGEVECAAREGWRAALLGEVEAFSVLQDVRAKVGGRLGARVERGIQAWIVGP